MVIALFAGAVFLDFIPRRKSRKKKENIVCGLLIAVSFVVLFLFSVGVKVPSPSKAIHDIVKMIAPIK
jgi:uncharacterized membrane protein YozB (DUF420 family)